MIIINEQSLFVDIVDIILYVDWLIFGVKLFVKMLKVFQLFFNLNKYSVVKLYIIMEN